MEGNASYIYAHAPYSYTLVGEHFVHWLWVIISIEFQLSRLSGLSDFAIATISDVVVCLHHYMYFILVDLHQAQLLTSLAFKLFGDQAFEQPIYYSKMLT